MTDDNMKIWDKVKQPPKEALKQITGGRLKGMTDINPQWRYEAMTKLFGPCGEGWKWTIERIWTEPGQEGQVFQFAQINLYFLNLDSWSDPIPGIGGSMLMVMESKGLHHNDEAVKMAITDALSVAMKVLGIGADIYAGLWDGSKYKNAEPEKKISEKQAADLRALMDEHGKGHKEDIFCKKFRIKRVEDLPLSMIPRAEKAIKEKV